MLPNTVPNNSLELAGPESIEAESEYMNQFAICVTKSVEMGFSHVVMVGLKHGRACNMNVVGFKGPSCVREMISYTDNDITAVRHTQAE